MTPSGSQIWSLLMRPYFVVYQIVIKHIRTIIIYFVYHKTAGKLLLFTVFYRKMILL